MVAKCWYPIDASREHIDQGETEQGQLLAIVRGSP